MRYSICLLLWLSLSFPAAAVPRIQCEQPAFDFGELSNSETVSHTFVIQNTGDKPLRITNVKSCCGAAAIAKDSMVPPGLTTEIRVKSSLHGRKGKQARTVTIYSNDPDHPQFECRLTGTAVAAVYTEPAMVNFGYISPSQNSRQIVQVISASGVPVKILSVTSSSGLFAAETLPPDQNGTARIRVSAADHLPDGSVVDQLTIETDHPQYPRLTLPVFAFTGDDLTVLPKEIGITRAELASSQPVMKSVLVRSASKQPFTVLKAEISGANVPVKISRMGESGTRITWVSNKIDTSWDGRKLDITVEQGGKQRLLEAPIRGVP